jgi:hypothetical protein
MSCLQDRGDRIQVQLDQIHRSPHRDALEDIPFLLPYFAADDLRCIADYVRAIQVFVNNELYCILAYKIYMLCARC